MKIIDHGKWIPYKPTVWPEAAPRNALFAKRESDGVDWYDYVSNGENFEPDSVKIAFTFHDTEQQWIIGPSTTDATLIFPANHYVREIIDFGTTDEDEIIAAFRNKAIDPETNALSDRIVKTLTPPQLFVMENLPDVLLDLIARVEKLEKGCA